jgi:hypothetical protein
VDDAISCRALRARPLLSRETVATTKQDPREVRSPATESGHDPDEPRYTGPERRSHACAVEVAAVRLTRKYADSIDGIDLSQRQVGDRLPLPLRDARMLIAEGWAEPVASQEQRDSPRLVRPPRRFSSD